MEEIEKSNTTPPPPATTTTTIAAAVSRTPPLSSVLKVDAICMPAEATKVVSKVRLVNIYI